MREFRAHSDRPKTGRLLPQAGTICSSRRFDQPLLIIGIKSLGRPRQIVSARWTALREVLLVPKEQGARRPAALRQWTAQLLSILQEQFTIFQAAKPATEWDASGNPGAVQIAKGLAAKAMRRAAADLNPAADLSYSCSLPLLCAFFCSARAQKCLDSCSTVETVKETQKTGASRGDNPVVTGLANCERAVCRVARLGSLPSGISRFIGPQRRRWTTSFSTSPAGAARAISPAMPPA